MQTLGFANATFAAFGGGGPGVATGDYVAVMTVGGKTLRQKIRVERGGISPQ
jgi:methyl coenzyme M reductase beta subunit